MYKCIILRKLFRNNLLCNNNMSSSSRALAAARAKRSGESAPPVSGNRPITSIGSQAAFAQQMPPHMGYNTAMPPNNVRVAKSTQLSHQQQNKNQQQQQQQYYEQPKLQKALPFQKLSLSDAIGLITMRLGRVEQWIIETDHEDSLKQPDTFSDTPINHSVIDNSVLATIINRLDSLEKNTSSENVKGVSETLTVLTDQFKRMCDDVAKHTIELNKNTEQVFRFNRELVETKDILKSFMVKYDVFVQDTDQNLLDYDAVFADLEKRIESNHGVATVEEEGTSIETIDVTSQAIDLKDMIKQELAKEDK